MRAWSRRLQAKGRAAREAQHPFVLTTPGSGYGTAQHGRAQDLAWQGRTPLGEAITSSLYAHKHLQPYHDGAIQQSVVEGAGAKDDDGPDADAVHVHVHKEINEAARQGLCAVLLYSSAARAGQGFEELGRLENACGVVKRFAERGHGGAKWLMYDVHTTSDAGQSFCIGTAPLTSIPTHMPSASFSRSFSFRAGQAPARDPGADPMMQARSFWPT